LVLFRVDQVKWATMRRTLQALVLLSCTVAFAAIAHRAYYGSLGLEARAHLLLHAAQLEKEIARLEAERVRLARHVALLSAVPPDPDLVEEIAREMLGFGREGERTVDLSPPSRRH
jgi:cell division protein FtsB